MAKDKSPKPPKDPEVNTVDPLSFWRLVFVGAITGKAHEILDITNLVASACEIADLSVEEATKRGAVE
jgi:hypothetical protein